MFEEIDAKINPTEFLPQVKALVGDRFAGDWPDSTTAPPRLIVAVKDLSNEEAERISGLVSPEGRELLALVAVKYSEADLTALERPLMALLREASAAGKIDGYTIRKDRPQNLIRVSLRTAPDPFVDDLRAAAPLDVLEIIVRPDTGSRLRNASPTAFVRNRAGRQ